ncbi:hypothetical protein ACWGQ5_00345 [Streptomyces sp. NPDC055722]
MTTTKKPTSAAAAPWPKLLAQGMTQPTPDPTRTPRRGSWSDRSRTAFLASDDTHITRATP